MKAAHLCGVPLKQSVPLPVVALGQVRHVEFRAPSSDIGGMDCSAPRCALVFDVFGCRVHFKRCHIHFSHHVMPASPCPFTQCLLMTKIHYCPASLKGSHHLHT